MGFKHIALNQKNSLLSQYELCSMTQLWDDQWVSGLVGCFVRRLQNKPLKTVNHVIPSKNDLIVK